MTIGYARIAKENEDLTQQIETLKAAGCDVVYSEVLSGVAGKDTKINTLLDTLSPGDTVVVCSLDRLGRSYFQTMHLLSKILEAGAHVFSIKEKIKTNEGKLFSLGEIVAIFSCLEKSFIRERGNLAAWYHHNKTTYSGRPKGMAAKTMNNMKRAKEMRTSGRYTVPEIANELGVKTGTLYMWATRLRRLEKKKSDSNQGSGRKNK